MSVPLEITIALLPSQDVEGRQKLLTSALLTAFDAYTIRCHAANHLGGQRETRCDEACIVQLVLSI